jgi:hypothetical protein
LVKDGQAPDRGCWEGDDQAATARQAWSALPDPLDEMVGLARCSHALAHAVAKRAYHPDGTKDPKHPTVVLVTDSWREYGTKMGWARMPDIDDGSRQLAGYLLVSPPNFGTAYGTALATADLGAAFDWIENNLGFGDLPAIALNPAATIPELKLYENGICDQPAGRSIPIFLTTLELGQLDGALDLFWRQVVVAPGSGRVALWKDGAKFIPIHRPEKAIQNELLKSLRVSFPSLGVKPEEVVETGRVDLRISGSVTPDGNVWVNHAVIELKVLDNGNTKPPFRDTQAIRGHIMRGVQQAAAYRMPPEPSRIAILACYDMRAHAGQRPTTCFDHIRDYASAESVELRLWPLFPSSESYRDYLKPLPDAHS